MFLIKRLRKHRAMRHFLQELALSRDRFRHGQPSYEKERLDLLVRHTNTNFLKINFYNVKRS